MTTNFALSTHPVAGDPIPAFSMPILSGPHDFSSDKLAGRHTLLLFMGSAAHPDCARALALIDEHHGLFDDEISAFFAVTVDQDDFAAQRVTDKSPGRHVLFDFDRALSRTHGAAADTPADGSYRPHWLVMDPALRVIGRFPLAQGQVAIQAFVRALTAPQPEIGAPVLTVPHVLEPDYRQALIAYYETNGGSDSGFMRELDGKTVGVSDHRFKRRSDCMIDDPALQAALNHRVIRRLTPAIRRAFQFEATRIERHIVACYDGTTGGFFAAHRDNTTPATAHRRFAVTINLNDEFEGGELRFPEFGRRSYRAPAGSAIVFACGLLHEALPVRSGTRYATLPFLYDEAAAMVRDANRDSLIIAPKHEQAPVRAVEV
jgi:predicted 2-oxoglutarate/Fe(II)-dependent dioxygenase YbiX/peroxiredoxin